MPQTQMPGFVVRVPIRSDPARYDLVVPYVRDGLEGLGNPAGEAMRKALDLGHFIHFMSLSVIWDGTQRDRPLLLADISGDGSPTSIIDRLVDHAGVLLLPVFQIACGVNSLDELKAVLKKGILRAQAFSLPAPGRTIGLAFQGTPDLTVERILADDQIAKIARQAVIACHGSHPATTPLPFIDAARARVAEEGSTIRPGVIGDPQPKAPPRPDGAKKARQVSPPSAPATRVLGDVLTLVAVVTSPWLIGVFLGWVLPTLGIHLTAKARAALSVIAFSVLIGIGVTARIYQHVKAREPTSDGLEIARRVSMQSAPAIMLIGIALVASFLVAFSWLADVFSEAYLLPDLATYWAVATQMAFSVLASSMLVGIGLLYWLHVHEQAAVPRDLDPDVAIVSEIMGRENQCVQNHMIGVSTITSVFFRTRISLVFAFYFIKLFIKAGVWQAGFLNDLGNIHFAQWVRLPGTLKLIFLSNYDGSWENYLENFVMKASPGVNAFWSNTADYPRTQLLFLKGCDDGERFKRWARRQQIPTPFWYSAYPDLTTTVIRNNAKIRSGLADVDTETKAEDWLKLFGSAPRPISSIETNEIQGLVLSGYRRLLHGAMLAVSFPEAASGADIKLWLSAVAERVTFGEAANGERAISLALSARGFARLGLGNDSFVSNFATPFILGMDHPARANVLGDLGQNAPEKWHWGDRRNAVDAVVLLYAKNASDLVRLRDQERTEIQMRRLDVVKCIRFRSLPTGNSPIREPFGYIDGVSQPAIRGLLSSREAKPADILAAGEFILGYEGGRGRFPPTPQIRDVLDPSQKLPDLPHCFPISPSAPGPVRDLGQNGSFLVIRQLEQDVDGFEAFLTAKAAGLQSPYSDAREWLAAKMVGRWRKNGAPLVNYPFEPPAQYDAVEEDEPFLFGRDDPQGQRCPFGAHIRRANPRDSFDADDPDQIQLVNRHRIIRRGRAYVADDDPCAKGRGLLFMCLNSDLERQFEFLQQTWILSNAFNGLRGEADPLMTTSETLDPKFTIPLTEGVQLVTGLTAFITMRGGGYFFLPSARALEFLAS